MHYLHIANYITHNDVMDLAQELKVDATAKLVNVCCAAWCQNSK